MNLPDSGVADVLRHLEWDTAHFGFAVSQIAPSELPLSALENALAHARQAGCQLVYWAAQPTQAVPQMLLQDWSGALVDRRVTYELDLSRPSGSAIEQFAGTERISEFPKADPSEGLLSLAVAAGKYSRFRRDTRIPEDKFRSLYETWIRRSTRRELASAVLVASTPAAACAGMVTVLLESQRAKIGLIAVHESCRQRGIGSRLMHSAHKWMLKSNAKEAVVVTQQDNVGACRLYERLGYRRVEVRHIYHFWPACAE